LRASVRHRNANEKSHLRSIANGFKVEDRGLEPLTDFDATDVGASTSADRLQDCAARALHPGGTACRSLSSLDADLQSVIAAWDDLPAAIRMAITALLEYRK
jgi:hypothetical protein